MAITTPSRRSTYGKIVRNVTRDVTEHPRNLTRYYAEQFKVSRVTANKYISKLEEEGWIARSGTVTHPVFSPGYKRRITGYYGLAGLEEEVPWEKEFSPYFSLSPNVRNIAHHGFTEMVNNAIDHSEGEHVFIYMSQDESNLWLAVSDDGIGIFEKIATALSLPDRRQAVFELAKGKLTTDPSKHSGEGVFFTSRMFDLFSIEANGLEFSHDDGIAQDWLREEEGNLPVGTTVLMKIELTSTRTTADVYAQFTDASQDYDFSKTIVPMKLARYGGEQLVSRSQAKRLVARFDRFKVVILDFEGIGEVGQAFADELFRVYAKAHRDVELVPRNMTRQVERMWLRAVNSQVGA